MKRKVLIIMNSLNCGGEENFVMNLYRELDRDKIQVDFLVAGVAGQEQFFENEIRSKGGRIYKVPGKQRKPIKTFLDVYHIIRKNQYRVVHRHSDNSLMILDLWAAMLGGATMYIAHSHNSNVPSGNMKMLHFIFRPFLNMGGIKRYACGIKAGEWMYGKKRFEVVKNGIDTKKFAFNSKNRLRRRNYLGIENEVLLGHIGRFDVVKNQGYLISILEILNKKYPLKYKLLLVGDGVLQQSVKEMVCKKGLEKEVFFLGQRDDIKDWMQAIDLMIFPSLFEGVPLTLVEAQASGTRCLVSDTVSSEVAITPLLEFLSLNDGEECWAERISRISVECRKMDGARDMVVNEGYDILDIAKKFERIYLEG